MQPQQQGYLPPTMAPPRRRNSKLNHPAYKSHHFTSQNGAHSKFVSNAPSSLAAQGYSAKKQLSQASQGRLSQGQHSQARSSNRQDTQGQTSQPAHNAFGFVTTRNAPQVARSLGIQQRIHSARPLNGSYTSYPSEAGNSYRPQHSQYVALREDSQQRNRGALATDPMSTSASIDIVSQLVPARSPVFRERRERERREREQSMSGINGTTTGDYNREKAFDHARMDPNFQAEKKRPPKKQPKRPQPSDFRSAAEGTSLAEPSAIVTRRNPKRKAHGPAGASPVSLKRTRLSSRRAAIMDSHTMAPDDNETDGSSGLELNSGCKISESSPENTQPMSKATAYIRRPTCKADKLAEVLADSRAIMENQAASLTRVDGAVLLSMEMAELVQKILKAADLQLLEGLSWSLLGSRIKDDNDAWEQTEALLELI